MLLELKINMRKKNKNQIIIISVLALLVISGIIAYQNNKEDKTNKKSGISLQFKFFYKGKEVKTQGLFTTPLSIIGGQQVDSMQVIATTRNNEPISNIGASVNDAYTSRGDTNTFKSSIINKPPFLAIASGASDSWTSDTFPTDSFEASTPTTFTVCVEGTRDVDGYPLIDIKCGSGEILIEPESTGLIAYYDFDNNVQDNSGKNHHGTLIGSSVYVDAVAGKGIEFTGANNYVSVPDAPDLDTNVFTIMFWMKADIPSTRTQALIGRGEDTPQDKAQYVIELHDPINPNKLQFWYEEPVNDADHYFGTTTTIQANKWYHFAVTRDATGLVKTYINGTKEFERTDIPEPAHTIGPVGIGARFNSPNVVQDYFDGVMDEVKIYNQALTETEISNIYNTYTPPIPPPTPDIISIRVSGGNDDAEEATAGAGIGSISFTSTDLELVEDGTRGNQYVGMLFRNILITQGKTIKSAYIEFTVDEAGTAGTKDPNLIIYAHNVDNAPAFTSTNYDLSSRPSTTSTVNWLITDSWAIGSKKKTIDISLVIQEIVNRPGWVSGNSIAILIRGTGKRTAASYNGNAGNAPLLVVEV